MRNIKLNTIIYDEFVVNNDAGALVTGLVNGDFTKKLYNPSGNEVSGSIPVTVTELGNGLYRTSFTPNALGAWVLIITNVTYFPYGKVENYSCITYLNDDLGTIVELIKQIGSGRWKIDTSTKEMILYKDDNITELFRFNLKDASGVASATSVFERERQ
jgi:hypothetical protein